MRIRLNRLLSLGLYLAAFFLIGCSAEGGRNANRLLRAPIVGLVLGDQMNIAIVAISAGKARVVYGMADNEERYYSSWEPLNSSHGFTASLA